jgi:hypothetical protein
VNPERRKKSQHEQIKQVKVDLARLKLTTGAHSALLVVPESRHVHKFATAGDFNGFLSMYASTLEAQRKKERRAVNLRIDSVWERFQGQCGVHLIEALCSALHDQGCDEGVVEDAKDAYLASLISHENPEMARDSLARHLTCGLQRFLAECATAEQEGGPVPSPSPGSTSTSNRDGAMSE